MIVLPHPRSRHVIKTSVVMIFVSSTHSSHTCDKSKILSKTSTGIFWSKNQSVPIFSGFSCSRRRQRSYVAVGIEGASQPSRTLCEALERELRVIFGRVWCLCVWLHGISYRIWILASKYSVDNHQWYSMNMRFERCWSNQHDDPKWPRKVECVWTGWMQSWFMLFLLLRKK